MGLSSLLFSEYRYLFACPKSGGIGGSECSVSSEVVVDMFQSLASAKVPLKVPPKPTIWGNIDSIYIFLVVFSLFSFIR